MKDGFVRRLNIAPTNTSVHYHTAVNPSLPALRNYAYGSPNIRMIGKVGYGSGQSSLNWETKQQIEQSLLSARSQFGPNATVVVMGFADKSGPYDTNLGISKVRAGNVQQHINELNWKHRLQVRTDIVAMGEEIELCSNELSHHRVAEIWVVAQPVAQPTVAPTHMSQANPYRMQPQYQQPTHHTQPYHPGQIQQPQPYQQPYQGAASSAPTSFNQQPNVPVNPVAQMPSGLPGNYQQQVTAPVAAQPQQVAVNNPMLGLIQYLEKNVVLAPNADPNEFAGYLNQLKQMGAAQ